MKGEKFFFWLLALVLMISQSCDLSGVLGLKNKDENNEDVAEYDGLNRSGIELVTVSSRPVYDRGVYVFWENIRMWRPGESNVTFTLFRGRARKDELLRDVYTRIKTKDNKSVEETRFIREYESLEALVTKNPEGKYLYNDEVTQSHYGEYLTRIFKAKYDQVGQNFVITNDFRPGDIVAGPLPDIGITPSREYTWNLSNTMSWEDTGSKITHWGTGYGTYTYTKRSKKYDWADSYGFHVFSGINVVLNEHSKVLGVYTGSMIKKYKTNYNERTEQYSVLFELKGRESDLPDPQEGYLCDVIVKADGDLSRRYTFTIRAPQEP